MESPAASTATRVLVAVRHAAAWLRPRLRHGGRLLGIVALAAGAWTLRHRVGVIAVLTRLLWWGSLGTLVLAGTGLLGGPAVAAAHPLHLASAGLGACVMVLVLARERRMRLAAFGLGLGHGTLAMLAWTVAAG